MVADGIRTARELGLADLLANTTGLTGFTPAQCLSRVTPMALKWAQSAGARAACGAGGAHRADRSAEDRRADVPEPRRQRRRVLERNRRARLARRATRPRSAHAESSEPLPLRGMTRSVMAWHCAPRCDARAWAHELSCESPDHASALPAGDFSTWLHAMRRALAGGPGMQVACGDCVGCCTSSYFIKVRPRESEALRHIRSGAPDPGARRAAGHVAHGLRRAGALPDVSAPAAALSTRIARTPAGPTIAASSPPPA